MAWSIAEVARMSKVTSRTLRHYGDVGLLPPAYVGSNGYRYYEQEQLLRLQRILLLRDLGLGLSAIAEVLAGERDQVAALRAHERWLHAERDRLGRLADTVSRTIHTLEEGEQMSGEEYFDGFAEKRDRLEADLVAEHGEGVRESFRSAAQVTKDWTREDHVQAKQRWDDVDDRVLEVLRSGAAPDSPQALDAMQAHYEEVARYWAPDAASYAGLGQLYVADPDFRARYDAKDRRSPSTSATPPRRTPPPGWREWGAAPAHAVTRTGAATSGRADVAAPVVRGVRLSPRPPGRGGPRPGR